MSLKPIAFNPCVAGARSRTAKAASTPRRNAGTSPSSNRRVWGLGVWKGPNGETRLYYSVASSPDLGGSDWASLPDDEKRNTLWSVRLGRGRLVRLQRRAARIRAAGLLRQPAGRRPRGLQPAGLRHHLPGLLGPPVMLVAERGGLRNLGLGQENAFATPHESRTIRYQLDQSGTWRAVGRYDVGMYDRSKEGAPYINANCAGGATFGPGYTADGRATGPADGFVWISGDKLCSPDGPCNPAGGIPEQAGAAGFHAGRLRRSSWTTPKCMASRASREDMYNALVPATANVQNQQTPAQPDRSGSGLHGRHRHQRRCGRQPDPRTGRQERRDHDRRHQRVPDLPAGQCGLLDGLPAASSTITAVASATTVPARTRGSSATGAGTRTAAGRAMTAAGRPATTASGRKVTGGT